MFIILVAIHLQRSHFAQHAYPNLPKGFFENSFLTSFFNIRQKLAKLTSIAKNVNKNGYTN